MEEYYYTCKQCNYTWSLTYKDKHCPCCGSPNNVRIEVQLTLPFDSK